jgi:hypothetical protein
MAGHPLPLSMRHPLVLQEHATHTIPEGWCVTCTHMGCFSDVNFDVTLYCIGASIVLITYVLCIPMIL